MGSIRSDISNKEINSSNNRHRIISSAFVKTTADACLPIEASIDIALANPNRTKNNVSRMPSIANTLNIQNSAYLRKEIVSRETILA